MLSNTSPLNWHSTLRRLRKDAQMGQLGKDIGILPGRKTFNAQLNGLTTKHRPTHVISEAAEPAENKVDKVHKVNKTILTEVRKAKASDATELVESESTRKTEEALDSIPSGAPPSPPKTPIKGASSPDSAPPPLPASPAPTVVAPPLPPKELKAVLEATELSKNERQALRDAILTVTGQTPSKRPINKEALAVATRLLSPHPAPMVGGGGSTPAPALSESGVWSAAEAAAAAYLETLSASQRKGAQEAVKTPAAKPKTPGHRHPALSPDSAYNAQTTVHSATAALLSPLQATAVNARRSVRTPATSTRALASSRAPSTKNKAPPPPSSKKKKREQAPLQEAPKAAEAPKPAQPSRKSLGVGPQNIRRARRGVVRSPVQEVAQMPTTQTPKPKTPKAKTPAQPTPAPQPKTPKAPTPALKAPTPAPPKAPTPAPPKAAPQDPLKAMKWPGTLKLAKEKGVSEEKIAEVTGQPSGAIGNTPTRLKKLKAYLRSM